MTEGGPRRGSTRRGTVALWWIVLSAAAIAVVAPMPYLTDSLRHLAQDNGEIAANYAYRPLWAQVAFYLHVCFAGLALLVSPAQFVTRLRVRAPRVHRICGRIATGCIWIAGPAGLVMAPLNLAGPVGAVGFGTLAVLWTGFAVAAYRAIRRGDVASHRDWAIRAFAMTYAAVMLRLWLVVLDPLQVAIGLDADTAFQRSYLIVSFLCWVPNLLVAEGMLRRNRNRNRNRRQVSETGQPRPADRMNHVVR
ncbi:DUF2306 domain-containing protein [Streptosporangium sp. NPDC051023]|uniref:DUF2306 domain-containing protein n=1 Tax=Streptosporangium sp. NPDC051023 TaxID=3155410 RepID=UPI0034508C52